MIVICRAKKDIFIHGLECVRDAQGGLMAFHDVDAALQYLGDHGYTTWDMENLGIFFTKLEAAEEEVLCQAYSGLYPEAAGIKLILGFFKLILPSA